MMRPQLCSKCKQNMAVIFITKLENGDTHNEGLCLKCARSLGIKPVDDMMKRMGISEDDLDNLTDEMMNVMNGIDGDEGLIPQVEEYDSNEEEGHTATFPF